MIVDQLNSLRERVIKEFCDVMEFKAFTDLAYVLGSERAHQFPERHAFRIRYTEFAHTIGLSDKDIILNDLPNHFSQAKDGYLFSLVHQHQVALFEHFFFDILRLLVTNHPLHLPGNKKVEYSIILKADTKDDIVSSLIERELNELKYKSVKEWFEYLGDLVSGVGTSDTDIGKICEAKATRDLLVHNAGVVNHIYIQKAGEFARSAVGDVISVAGHYTRDVWVLFSSVLIAVIDNLIHEFEN